VDIFQSELHSSTVLNVYTHTHEGFSSYNLSITNLYLYTNSENV